MFLKLRGIIVGPYFRSSLTLLTPLTQDLVSTTPNSSNGLRTRYSSNRDDNCGLSTSARTGGPIFHTLWSYVPNLTK